MTEADKERDEEDARRRTSLAAAVGHPRRQQILGALTDSQEAHSAHGLATELELPLGVVSYHVAVLRTVGAVDPGQIDDDPGSARG
jgi:DNA-binding transcriptional ArsR family regulator